MIDPIIYIYIYRIHMGQFHYCQRHSKTILLYVQVGHLLMNTLSMQAGALWQHLFKKKWNFHMLHFTYIIYIYICYIHRYIPFDGKNFISHVEDPNHATSTTIPPFEATNHGLGRVKVEQSESAGTLKQAPVAEAASLILEVPCI